jgi:serine/threonine-protein kinase
MSDPGDSSAYRRAINGARIFGPYQLEKIIGKGGMGHVIKGFHKELGRDVAIKVISPSMHRPDLVMRFKQEAKIMAFMEHQAIVDIHDAGTIDGIPFMALRYLPGGDFTRRISQVERMDVPSLIECAVELVSGIRYIHTMDYLHLDLKPQNILFDKIGKPVITDFGLARRKDTVPDMIAGTMAYIPPETIESKGRTVSENNDWYALGGILYWCMTGQPPYTGMTAPDICVKIACATSPPDHGLPDHPLAELVESLLHPNITKRCTKHEDIMTMLKKAHQQCRKNSMWTRWFSTRPVET